MALYRKYRPATFAEVVGQEQVTKPLSAALDAGRINHAYLFSGPRGCGKTSSARIMARSLNCVEGPTSTPCGVCDSCRSLAPGGPGNLDVTELDAASHNGVEDMRELRDRAYYAPAESRYRIFIIDEAHMISNAGSNALLKVVEEPPEHLIFIFATTEPEKVIGTIRSRTHHYPFRLLTPPDMRGLLERTVAAEGVHVDDSVYPLVIEAGGGSPRDTLSILDQLLAGAGEDGLTYDLARPLLGVTDVGLLDSSVEALAAGDKATMFRLVGDVIDAGHEPRRFATDLLDRLRDLLVLQVVPDAFDAGLVDAPTDRAEVLSQEAQQFSAERLTQLASILNEEIPNLRGATSPRLLLEILCARLLIGTPQGGVAVSAAGSTPGNALGAAKPQNIQTAQQASEAARAVARGAGQGDDERASSSTGSSPAGDRGPSQDRDTAAAAAQAVAAAAAAARRGREQMSETPVGQPKSEPAPQPPSVAAQGQPAPKPQAEPQQPERDFEPTTAPKPEQEQEAAPSAEPSAQASNKQSAEELAATIRDNWTRVRQAVGAKNKVAEIMLTEARVLGIKDDTLVLGHTTGALAERLNARSNNEPIVEVLRDNLGAELAVKCVIGTDPTAVGLSAPREPKPAWNPHKEERSDDADEETDRARSDSESSSRTESEPSADTAQADGWGTPRQLGGSTETDHEAADGAAAADDDAHAPRNERTGLHSGIHRGEDESAAQDTPRDDADSARAEESAPLAATNVAPSRQGRDDNRVHTKNDWQARIAHAQEVAEKRDQQARGATFSNGVPVPPEPEPEEGVNAPPPEPGSGEPSVPAQGVGPSAQGAQSRAEEEKMMAESAARETGEQDHRSATEVAVELLSRELGARPL